MQFDIVNSENKKVGSVDVSDDVFGGRVNADLIWESVVHANADPLRFCSAEEVTRSRRYHRPLYWAGLAALALEATVLALFAWTAVGDALDPKSLPWWARTLVYAAIIVVISAAVQLPLAYWRGYIREREWQFSTQTLGGWLSDRAKGTAVNVFLPASALLALVALVPSAAAAEEEHARTRFHDEERCQSRHSADDDDALQRGARRASADARGRDRRQRDGEFSRQWLVPLTPADQHENNGAIIDLQ